MRQATITQGVQGAVRSKRKISAKRKNGCWKPDSPDMSSDGPIDLNWKGTDGRKEAASGFGSVFGCH
jgi:hypothetical protein